MAQDLKAIYNLSKDLLEFRERLRIEIPEICDFDADLADHVYDARASLFTLFKDLDLILVENGC